MRKYLIRLDDASDHMDLEKWIRMENLLNKFDIKPIFGIIPQNADESLLNSYDWNPDFWELVCSWINNGWTPAMHGYEHRYVTADGGINPVNNRSEFAGLSYDEQAEKIRNGYRILIEHGISPEVFFAPSHTFDENTLLAIERETPIRIISDTIAYDIYKEDAFWFIPQQSGRVRKLPFKIITFCYHPNSMTDGDFDELEKFFIQKWGGFITVSTGILKNRKRNVIDLLLQSMYFARH